jgi:MerR family transcriptional regulator, light-induced transcriptional regulator
VLSSRHAAGAAPLLAAPPPAWRVAVVGMALAARLQRPALLRMLSRPVQLLGPFADVAQANTAMQGAPVDLLLVHAPRLHPDWRAGLLATTPALATQPTAVLYGFASGPTCDALSAAGVALLREPQNDTVLGQWLHAALQSAPPAAAPGEPTLPAPAAPPRRWDDAALADFAGLSSTIACECPRHVAELLLQLSHFEAYSAECQHRNAADAELHAYLQQVAATSRAHFEAALEQVALHEGLILPAASTESTESTKTPPPANPARRPR